VLPEKVKIRESQQVEVRAEFFNLLNRSDFGLPWGGSAVPADVVGGASITNTATDNRKIELVLKYAFQRRICCVAGFFGVSNPGTDHVA